MVKHQYKLICYLGHDRLQDAFELYDPDDDPEELEDIYSVKKLVAADLRIEMHEKLQAVNRPYV